MDGAHADGHHTGATRERTARGDVAALALLSACVRRVRGQLRGSVDSNERAAMIDYYVDAERAAPPDYYIYVHRPLSLERALPPLVAAHYHWLMALGVGDSTTIEIYAADPPVEAAPP